MPRLPLVAIIGRPNTGKSTLFNRLIGRRQAIESEVAGTTRDHISQRIDGERISYLLVDTGGMGVSADKDFERDVYEQSLLALKHADLIIFTVNGREELTQDDHRIVEVLRKQRKRHVPVIVVRTKIDNEEIGEEYALQAHELKIGEKTLLVSAAHRLGIDELKEEIESSLTGLGFKRGENEEGDLPPPPRIAIIGKPNVGKSSIVNAMMPDTQRAQSPLLVSKVAGTTRDSTDTEVKYEGRPYIFVDTAGLKKNSRTAEEVEHFSMLRSIQAIENSDIAVLVLDANEPVTVQDKRIARMAQDAGKGMVVLVNKIDQVKGKEREQKMHDIAILLQFCRYARFIPTSAKTREGLLKLYDILDGVYLSMRRRIPTPELRRWFENTTHGHPLGEIGKSKYITQADEIPPTFVIFVRNPKQVSVSQLRYMDNRLRETYGFEGTPIRWITKTSWRKEKR